MTIQFPDISQYTPVPLAGAPVALARATIGTVTDTHWQSNVQDAAAHGVPLLGYCFLNAGSLGPSPEVQADYAWSVVGTRPVMLDHEPNRGACASIGEARRWIDRFRYRGGTVRLHYLPRWAWQQLGSPGLQTLADRHMALVASNYTTYSDTGPGWQPYYPGCPVPVVQWQYSDRWPFNGTTVDWNAYRGTVADYLTLAGGHQMEQTDIVTGALARGNSVGDTLSDATNLRDEWYLAPANHSKNPPPPGSRFDALMQAAAKVNGGALGVTATVTQDQLDTSVAKVMNDPAWLAALAAALAGHFHIG